ncbi:hypothetical protein D0T51_03885 [Parabacteroides sp. 52]|uniref:S41 family peptidase n=1 Tax=unclassified Parabacteroides TaxID=2649774 RepID=UPI0013D1F5C9|nr:MULTISPECIES: S41 family peptidase [unclassified Parabacteroides]MDH6534375.1 carboxyl-terminal processing protease [Parabacteroides sp. PM5-20]NDV54873.1 hypothetical protein [Parabacteroides sp. 52]
MKRYSSFFVFVFACLCSLSACSKDDDERVEPMPVIEDVTNRWIYSTMKENYLWDIPTISKLPSTTADPETFFLSLLSKEDGKDINGDGVHDYFSYIEKKRDPSSKSVSAVDPTYGFDFIAYRVSGGNCYYARVLYVLPDSPAADAGLLRDDWIIGINGENNNLTDYMVLNGGGEVSLQLAEVDEKEQKLYLKKETLKLSPARIVENNPLLRDTVLDWAGKKVGYLVYNHFSSEAEGAGDEAYDKQMKAIFSAFKTAGVNEFVLDLRFNGGGLVSCARLLSSLLVPAADLNKVFCEMQYKNGNNTVLRFDSSVASSNLDLKRLYVLTGQFTASSSEAVINGLSPFMDVIIIGDQTVGKAVGSNTFGEDKSYDWLLHPITVRICNAKGEAAYSQVGFTPDPAFYYYEYNTNPFIKLYPLGDPREKLLSMALSDIDGGFRSEAEVLRTHTQTKAMPFLQPVYSSVEKNPSGLIVPLP